MNFINTEHRTKNHTVEDKISEKAKNAKRQKLQNEQESKMSKLELTTASMKDLLRTVMEKKSLRSTLPLASMLSG